MIRKISCNWHECRGWLYDYAIWKLILLIYTGERNSGICTLQKDHWYLPYVGKKIRMTSRKILFKHIKHTPFPCIEHSLHTMAPIVRCNTMILRVLLSLPNDLLNYINSKVGWHITHPSPPVLPSNSSCN